VESTAKVWDRKIGRGISSSRSGCVINMIVNLNMLMVIINEKTFGLNKSVMRIATHVRKRRVGKGVVRG